MKKAGKHFQRIFVHCHNVVDRHRRNVFGRRTLLWQVSVFCPNDDSACHPYLAILNILILPLTTTIAEDGIYLGYGVNSFASKWAAILIPAFFYALQHSFIPTIFDKKFMTYRFLSFLPLTIWICFQYYQKGSISYIMAGHWVLNIATTIQIAINSN